MINKIQQYEEDVKTRVCSKEQRLRLKEEQKQRAEQIRYLRTHRKLDKIHILNKPLWQVHCELSKLSWEYRYKHIAYCLLRGKKYSQIEQRSRIWDQQYAYDWMLLQKHVKETIEAYSSVSEGSEDTDE